MRKEEHKYGIKTVAIQTGLTQHIIRAWEKRYAVVKPLRTATNRRLYSDADIYRLTLMRLATEAGHRIGHIANLSAEELLKLIGTERTPPQPATAAEEVAAEESSLRAYIVSCITAIKQFETHTLEAILLEASVTFSRPVFLEKLIAPLMQEIGDQWRAGTLRIAHEHLATAVIRTLLGHISHGGDESAPMPNLVIATPRGQLHEIGALIAGLTAAAQGWQVTYLGSNLPAEEIAGCAAQKGAKAIGVSIVYPTDDPHLAHELQTLRRGLQDHVAMFVGGAGASAYRPALTAIGAVIVEDMATFCTELEALRV